MILASQSPRRRELLEQAGFELSLAPADIDESRLPGERPVELVERLAREKAEAALAGLGAARLAGQG
ncbi:MAG TPA: septum formation inhibitor Maf, partial [Olsenella sp.]|nr:septum formation inhibitor Maf [Olsenella sp.]